MIYNLFTKLAFVCLVATSLTACERDGPAERAGEKMDRAAEKMGEKMENAAENAGDRAEAARDRIEDKTD